MVVGIPRVQSAINFFKHAVLICYRFCQIFNSVAHSNDLLIYIFVVILFYILLTRHEYILCFLSIYYNSGSLLATNKK